MESPDDFEWEPLSAIGIDTFAKGGSTIVPLEAVAPAATTSLSTQPAGSDTSQALVSAPIDGQPDRQRAPHRSRTLVAMTAAACVFAGVFYGGSGEPPDDPRLQPPTAVSPRVVLTPQPLVSASIPVVLTAAPVVVRTDVLPLPSPPRPVVAPAITRRPSPPPVTARRPLPPPVTARRPLPPPAIARRPPPQSGVAQNGTLSVNARPWANVWVDGTAIGETPIGKHHLTAGRHRVVFRHPELGERLVMVTVTAGEESYATADFARPDAR